MVHVYVPAARLLAVGVLPPDGAHEYVYGPVPPEGAAVAVPLLLPKHKMLAEVVMDAVMPPEFATVVVAVVVQPFASVTVTV